MDNNQLTEITSRLDKVVALLEIVIKPTSTGRKIIDGFATGAGILGILGAIEVIRTWLIGG
jgi:N-acetylmuramic acid 6-phosphate (MurNAc-6-P) etherase